MFKNSIIGLLLMFAILSSGCIITGKVTDENGNGIEGVTVTLTGAANLTTTTNSGGGYIFGNFFDVLLSATTDQLSLIMPGSYTVTPSKSGCTFSPGSSAVSVTNGCYGPLALDLPWPVGGVDFEANCTLIDWDAYFNWQVGRAWQYQTTASKGTYSEYIKEMTTKNNLNVYVLGWSANWSDQLDYWNFESDGIYLIGFFDEEQRIDLFISPPYWTPNTVQLGNEYTQTVYVGGNAKETKRTVELVDGVTVPYGTFNEVIKVTFKTQDETSTNWYAKGVGQIMRFKDSSNRTDKLINITDGHTSQPLN